MYHLVALAFVCLSKMHGQSSIKYCSIFCPCVFYFSELTPNLLMTTIVETPSNASKWQMGFNSAFKGLRKLNLMFEFPCITSLYYIMNQQDATLALFISHCKITLHVSDAFCFHHQEYRLWNSAVTTDRGHPYWIYIIPTYDMHQWLLLQFLVLLMMDAESVRNM